MAMIRDGKVYRNVPEQVQKNKEDIERINGIISDLGTVLVYKGSVPTYADLPTEDVKIGDFYNVLDTGDNYAWDGEAWDKMSATVDLSHLVTLDTDQTITGVKTISSSLNFNKDGTDTITWKIVPNNYHGIDIRRENTTLIGISGGNISTHTHTPYTTATYDLGSSNTKWKDLYLSGKVNLGSSGYTYIEPTVSGLTVRAVGGEFTTNANITPVVSATYDIGASGARWKDLYLNGDANTGSVYVDTTKDEHSKWHISTGNYLFRVLDDADRVKFYSSWTDFVTNENVRPNITNTYDLGNSSYNWKDLYLDGELKLYGANSNYWNLKTDDTYNQLRFRYNNAEHYVFSDYQFRPSANNTKDLGSASYKWKDLYLNGNITDGTNSVAVQDIPSKSAENTFEEDMYLDGADLYVTGNIQATNYKENLIGYSVYAGSKEGVTYTPDYVKVSKVGNMLTFEWLETITRTGDVANDFFALGYLYIPQEVYNKITQYTSGPLTNCVKNLSLRAYSGPNTSINTNVAITGVVNGSSYALQPYIYNASTFALNTTYKLSVQASIMLGTNLAA